MKEVFRPIDGYDNNYFIGSFGTVKNKFGKALEWQHCDGCIFVVPYKDGVQRKLSIRVLLLTYYLKTLECALREKAAYDDEHIAFDTTCFYHHYIGQNIGNYKVSEIAKILENKTINNLVISH